MNNAFWNNEALLVTKLDSPILEVDDKTTVKDKEELVIVIVLVPVILALQDT
jgi:hypothetical protein